MVSGPNFDDNHFSQLFLTDTEIVRKQHFHLAEEVGILKI